MASVINLTSMTGADDTTSHCYLLQVDEMKLLLDCGWNENFSMGTIENIKKHIKDLDAVFLSYPDPYHLGAVPHLVGKMGIKCPIYATIPVRRIGQVFMYDLYLSKSRQENFNLFTLDDIDKAFESIKQLAYNETIETKGRKGTTLRATPLRAGHMIGGSAWKIVKDEKEVILYGVDYNHKKERHLDGCSFENVFRPHIFITDSFVTDCFQSKTMSRDDQLTNAVTATLSSGGNVLVSTDTGGRVLEIAYLLEQMWANKEAELSAYKVVILSNVAYNVKEFACSMIEWMNEKISRALESTKNNEFRFKHVQICHSMEVVNNLTGPKVVLASVPDMESGFSRELFIKWCGNPQNSIILTTRTSPGTLTRTLIDEPKRKRFLLNIKKRIPIGGLELERYMQEKSHQQLANIKVEEDTENESHDYSSDSDDEGWEGAYKKFQYRHDFVVKGPLKRKAFAHSKLFDSCVMFPNKRRKVHHNTLNQDLGFDYCPKLFAKVADLKQDDKPKPKKEFNSMELEETPTKTVTSTQSLDIQAKVLFIDFDGRSDADFLKNIISQTKPLQLVLVKGNGSSLESICKHAMNRMPSNGRIIVPKSNESVDLTMDSQISSVKISDALVKSLVMKKVKNYEVSWIDALVTMEAEEDGGTVPTLDVLPDEMVKPHAAVVTNNMRLLEFKEILIKNGFRVEFRKGDLLVNEKITIRKDEHGSLVPIGMFCKDFVTLMELVEKQFVVL